ncbi:MAG: tetratricopeptide repeat protein [Phycisphaerales bacterium JB043]
MNRATRALLITTLFCAMLLLAPGCARQRGPRQIVLDGVQPVSQRLSEARQISQRAQAAAERGDLEQAELLYLEALAVYDEFAPAWNNLGLLYLEQERFMDAAGAFAEALTKAPMDPRPAYNLGLTWERAGYLSDAVRHYASALERDPRFLPALRGAIRADQLLGEMDEVTAERLRVALLIERDPEWRSYFEEQKTRLERLAKEMIGIRSGDD